MLDNYKALDILKRLKIGTVTTKVDGDRVLEPLCMAIEALEKQTPKERLFDAVDTYMCPNCEEEVYDNEYCSSCGQHLKL